MSEGDEMMRRSSASSQRRSSGSMFTSRLSTMFRAATTPWTPTDDDVRLMSARAERGDKPRALVLKRKKARIVER